MSSYLKRYKITVKTDGAVFIGSGYTLKANGYIDLDDKILVPEQDKLFEYICARGLKRKFERFVDNSGKYLGKWLKECEIPLKEYSKFGGYYVEKYGKELKGVKEIMTCIKDAYGCPYIPGSSLKGAIRTVLLWNEIDRKYDQLSNERKRISNISGTKISEYKKEYQKEYQKIITDIESEEFNTLDRTTQKENAVNDSLSCIRISDSKPLNTSCLSVCPKMDYDIDGNSNGQTVIHRECIKPGTTAEFEMTIDTAQTKYTAEDITEAIKNYYRNYVEIVDKKFGDSISYKDSQYIYIGGGAGYVSKTVMYGLFRGKEAVRATHDMFKKTLSSNIYKKHCHANDIELGVSPHMIKRTKYNGYEYYMGKCRIAISEI